MSERFVTRGLPAGGTQGRAMSSAFRRASMRRGTFPVLSAGLTPRIRMEYWSFTIRGLVKQAVKWSWDEFQKLPSREFIVDIHCVTKWSKLDTRWRG